MKIHLAKTVNISFHRSKASPAPSAVQSGPRKNNRNNNKEQTGNDRMRILGHADDKV